MTRAEYFRLSPIIHKGDEALKTNDFDKFFQKISPGVSEDTIAEIYVFFAENLGIDPILHMTNIPKKFFSKIPVGTLAIPSNIRAISPQAFANNTYLEKVEFAPTAMIEDIPEDCFAGCKNLESVILSNNTTYIDRDAFDRCDNVTIYVPNVAIAKGFRIYEDDIKSLRGKVKKM